MAVVPSLATYHPYHTRLVGGVPMPGWDTMVGMRRARNDKGWDTIQDLALE
jgi:hypothetical protein